MSNSVAEHKATAQAAREALAELVRMERARRRLSQYEVAKIAGTSPMRISEIENVSADPRFSTVVRVADALGLTVKVDPTA